AIRARVPLYASPGRIAPTTTIPITTAAAAAAGRGAARPTGTVPLGATALHRTAAPSRGNDRQSAARRHPAIALEAIHLGGDHPAQQEHADHGETERGQVVV